jgi:hypothetical protein
MLYTQLIYEYVSHTLKIKSLCMKHGTENECRYVETVLTIFIGFPCRNSRQDRFYSSPLRPHQLWHPSSLPSNWYSVLFPRVKRSERQANQHHLVAMFRMCGVASPSRFHDNLTVTAASNVLQIVTTVLCLQEVSVVLYCSDFVFSVPGSTSVKEMLRTSW